jgi:hypothetical protein
MVSWVITPSSSEVNEFYQFIYSFQAHYGLWVDSDSNRNEIHKMFLRNRARPELKDDNLTAICEPVV